MLILQTFLIPLHTNTDTFCNSFNLVLSKLLANIPLTIYIFLLALYLSSYMWYILHGEEFEFAFYSTMKLLDHYTWFDFTRAHKGKVAQKVVSSNLLSWCTLSLFNQLKIISFLCSSITFFWKKAIFQNGSSGFAPEFFQNSCCCRRTSCTYTYIILT